MKSAFIYVRVSTDEQRRQGYSLIEQEERLLQHCEINNIHVTGIFREDHSAKDFNRPEWKKLINVIRKNKNKPPMDILFLKWDRFSRNIQYAYQMIGMLRNMNIKTSAIDQPIDFEVPESIVMLAVYLSIPEAENSRRGKNTSDGMRRARKMGRWPSRAPIGYANLTTPDGKKFIAPKQPEADHIRWSFEQMASGNYTLSDIKRMAILRGFNCGKNNLSRLIHNPIYCGIVTITATKDEEKYTIRGIHEPIITEELFQNVQALLISKRRQRGRKENLKQLFPLRGFLMCPLCNRRMTGSASQGRCTKYRYYHCCTPRCKGRFKADALESAYEGMLKDILILPAALTLFKLVLADQDVFTEEKLLTHDRVRILDELSRDQAFMSKARKLFVDDKIDFEDFGILKKEHSQKLGCLNERLAKIDEKLVLNEVAGKNKLDDATLDILSFYKGQDIVGKRYITNLFRSTSIDISKHNLGPLEVDPALKKIIIDQKGAITYDRKTISSHGIKKRAYPYGANKGPKVFSCKKVSTTRAMEVLRRDGILIDDGQAETILDFLYTIAKTYSNDQLNSENGNLP